MLQALKGQHTLNEIASKYGVHPALRPLAHRNRRRIFTLLFQAAAQTLLTLGRDPARLGVQPGLTAVLHTWTRELQFHPHVHCIVTGGGLTLDRTHWKAARRRYLFPVKVLSRLFRGMFLAALTEAYRNHELELGGSAQPLGDAVAFQRFVDARHRIEWVVYAKRPLGGPQQVVRYLGRYTHCVGLSNSTVERNEARVPILVSAWQRMLDSPGSVRSRWSAAAAGTYRRSPRNLISSSRGTG